MHNLIINVKLFYNKLEILSLFRNTCYQKIWISNDTYDILSLKLQLVLNYMGCYCHEGEIFIVFIDYVSCRFDAIFLLAIFAN